MPLNVTGGSPVLGCFSATPITLNQTKITQKNVARAQKGTEVIRVIETSKLRKRASNTRSRTESIEEDK